MISNCFLFVWCLFVCFVLLKMFFTAGLFRSHPDLVVFCNKKVLYTLMVPLSLEEDLLITVGRIAERLCNGKSHFKTTGEPTIFPEHHSLNSCEFFSFSTCAAAMGQPAIHLSPITAVNPYNTSTCERNTHVEM